MQNTVITWMGQKLEDLSKEELIKAIEYSAKEIERLQQDRDRWRNSGDTLKYLMQAK